MRRVSDIFKQSMNILLIPIVFTSEKNLSLNEVAGERAMIQSRGQVDLFTVAFQEVSVVGTGQLVLEVEESETCMLVVLSGFF